MIGQSLRLAAMGIAIGGVTAFVLSPWLEAQLFGVRGTDPMTYAGVALALVLTALIGACIPARKAMSVDPASALRQ
jgi:ABC-type lipoprotein release transport system permease subunit